MPRLFVIALVRAARVAPSGHRERLIQLVPPGRVLVRVCVHGAEIDVYRLAPGVGGRGRTRVPGRVFVVSGLLELRRPIGIGDLDLRTERALNAGETGR